MGRLPCSPEMEKEPWGRTDKTDSRAYWRPPGQALRQRESGHNGGMGTVNWEAVTASAAVVAAVIAAASAFAAFRAARAARNAVQAQLLIILLTDWGSAEMRRASNELVSWRDSNAETRRNLASAMQPYRQALSLYFQKVHELRRNGLISKGVVRSVASHGQATLYLAIEPLERLNNPQYDTSSFVFYSRFYDLPRDTSAVGWQSA